MTPDEFEQQSEKSDPLEQLFEKHKEQLLKLARPEIEHGIQNNSAERWRERAKLSFEIINSVAAYDKEHSREAFRRWITYHEPLSNDPTPSGSAIGRESDNDELLEIASRIANLLEERNSPYCDVCKVSEDLSWVRDVVNTCRSIRELVVVLMELPQRLGEVDFNIDVVSMTRWTNVPPVRELASALKKFSHFITSGRPRDLVVRVYPHSWEGEGGLRIERISNPSLTPLHSEIAQQMSEYFVEHREVLNLAVCVECSRIFRRSRSDNAYCSKTCQNRVAYKRKRMIDSGALTPMASEPRTVEAMRPGLWVNHPRWGLGVVEQVRFSDRKLASDSEKGVRFLKVLEHETVEEAKVRLGELQGADFENAIEVREPKSLIARIRFLSGVVRSMSWSDFLAEARSRVVIFEVKDPEALMRML